MLEASFPSLRSFVQECQANTSSNAKKEILTRYPDLKEIFQYVYNPYIKFYTTSDNVKKQSKALQSEGPNLFGGKGLPLGNLNVLHGAPAPKDFKEVLDQLSARTLSGFEGIKAILKVVKNNKLYEDLIYMILDKDLKVRIDVKSINKVYPKLIPTFNVALANKYKDVEDKVDFGADEWFASHKLDGFRCITVVDGNGKVTCYTRTGNEYKTLGRVIEEIKRLYPTLRNTVFDGELCIVDEKGAEHFDWMQKEWNKDNHTIAFPRYKLFDMLTLDEFTTEESTRDLLTRLEALNDMLLPSKILNMLEQKIVMSKIHLDDMAKDADDKGWEGLIIRKNAPYLGKRSNDLLKVKTFEDIEVVVEGIETGPFRYVKNKAEAEEEMMTSIYFTFFSEKLQKSNRVDVGSGFSIEQRQRFFAHPEEIIGKTITVKYFEETINSDTGLPSLRFPVLKTIWENGRDE